MVVPPSTQPAAGVAVPSEPNSATASCSCTTRTEGARGSRAAAAEGTSAVFKLVFSN